MDLQFSIWNPYEHTRLDTFLTACTGESRNTLKKWFNDSKIHLNQTIAKPSMKPGVKQSITLIGYTHSRTLEPNPDLTIPILYEDNDLLVINKPRGQSVNALRHIDQTTIANFFLHKTPTLYDWDTRILEPGLVHRLDKWTSGCLIGVRTQAALEFLKTQFMHRRIKKNYLALANGHIHYPMALENWLIHHPKNPQKMTVTGAPEDHPQARIAKLSFTPIQWFENHTLIDVRLKTGRMHQIRVQLAHQQHPLAGDSLYGGPSSKGVFDGFWLHAHTLAFNHPTTHQQLCFRAPIPQALIDYLDTLKRIPFPS